MRSPRACDRLTVVFVVLAFNSFGSAAVDDRVQRAINGLLPETHLNGQFGPRSSLAERMAHFHTPGVSIAVVNDFRIEWARKGKVQRFSHGGWDEGFVAQMTIYCDHGKRAVVLLNANEGDPLLREVERATREYDWPDCFPPEKRPIELGPEHAEALVGQYVSKRGVECAITRVGHRLFFKMNAQNPTVLSLELKFTRGTNASINLLTCEQDGWRIELERKKRAFPAH